MARAAVHLALLCFLGFVSAQQCYHAVDQSAGSAYVPCASPQEGFSACCQLGDLCLSDSACWNPKHNITYLYGCTDPSYSDISCPYKCGKQFENDIYVGLDYCYNFTRNEWACTHPPPNAVVPMKFGITRCDRDSVVAFAGPKSLQPILSLPKFADASTVYFSEINPTSYTLIPGYTPPVTQINTASVPSSKQLAGQTPTPTHSTTTTPSLRSSSTTTTSITSTSSSSSTISKHHTSTTQPPLGQHKPPRPSSSSGGISTSVKVAIAIGAVAGVLLVVTLVALWILWRRRRAGPKQISVEDIKQDDSDSASQGSGHRRSDSHGYDQKAELSGGVVPVSYSETGRSRTELETPRTSKRYSSTADISWSPDGTASDIAEVPEEPVERYELPCTKD